MFICDNWGDCPPQVGTDDELPCQGDGVFLAVLRLTGGYRIDYDFNVLCEWHKRQASDKHSFYLLGDHDDLDMAVGTMQAAAFLLNSDSQVPEPELPAYRRSLQDIISDKQDAIKEMITPADPTEWR